ncbi:SIR7-like protein [Mya arenaria]|uniref:Regulatory protein SIR2 homolog 7 n=1 Tax=Mya arenaria TaxID=6604 RepID=A0ABY7DKW2_MYAAR|nr:SIR7-like protein [Mya arenaria]
MPHVLHIAMPHARHITMPNVRHIAMPHVRHIDMPLVRHIAMPHVRHIAMLHVRHIAMLHVRHIAMPHVRHIAMSSRTYVTLPCHATTGRREGSAKINARSVEHFLECPSVLDGPVLHLLSVRPRVSRILKKHEHERTVSELEHLEKHQDIVKRIRKNRERRQISEQRSQETEDSDDALQQKCEQLADILRKSKKTVIYTGAGISTAASIPDYRGPQGVWTLLKRGESIDPQDLSDAEPTLTHMCITQLHKQGHVKHVVSQNCDGLHVRSGLPRQVLSEVHGNMFIEICHSCKPHREYFRLFDTTESTGVRRHRTGRKCHKCGGELRDTIVHFGEKGGIKSPYRWKEAVKAANRSDVILLSDPLFQIATKLSKDEIDSTSKKILEHPSTSPTPGPLDGISRTPTPSDSSRSSASSSGTESGNEELDMEEMGDSDWQGKDDADVKSPEGTAHDWRYDVERIKGSIKHIQQEQRVIQEQRCLVQQEFVELDNAIKRKHQDEQMRLHQHFLLQEQHLSRAVDGASKKEGLMKLFVYQQQILLAQQNAHLIEITQKHAQQIKDLDVALARKHGELMSETKHLTECQNKLNLNSLQTHPLSPSGSGQQKSPNKTDFSITSILQQDTPVSPTSLPGVTELINTMLTCESCRFLKNYGVVKRKCQNCQQLKSRNGPILATVPGQVPNTAFRAESETASRVGSRERPKKVGRVASATVSSPDNIAYKQGTDLFKQKKVKSLHSTSIQNPLSQDNRLPISLLTAVTNEPCERTASASSKTTAVSKPVIKIQTAFAEPFQAGPKAKFSLWEDEPSEKIRNRPVTYVANNRLNIRGPKTRSKQEKVKTRTSKTAVNESHESSEQAAAHKPFRSHSHSDIYDDRQEGSNSVSPGSRQLRSHSHTVGTSASCSDLELTPSKSEDSLDSSLDGQSSGKKRKLMSL